MNDLGGHINLALENTKNLIPKIGDLTLKDYQFYTSRIFLGLKTLRKLLLFWDTGAGKTLESVYIINNLKELYHNWHIFILIPASLRYDPWEKTLGMYNTTNFGITIIHYDDPSTPSHIQLNRKIKEINLKNTKILFIIDECHNFISRSISKGDGKIRHTLKSYNFINQFINNNTMSKLLLISATPVLNNLSEYTTLLGMLRKERIELDENMFYNNRLISRKELIHFLGCSNSYYRLNEEPAFINTPVSLNFPEKNVIIKELFMTPYQSEMYKDAYYLEMSNKASGYRIYRRLASSFTFLNIEEDKDQQLQRFLLDFSNFRFSKEFIEVIKNDNDEYTNISNYFSTHITLKKKEEEKYFISLMNYSIKYIECCKILLRKIGKCLVYEPFVSFEGIATLSIYFKIFGIEFIVYSNNTKNRIFDLERFNLDENLNAENIKVCIISKAGMEGISFTGINELILLDIPWSEAQLRQIIGRGIRLNSHQKLPTERKYINVHILIAKAKYENSKGEIKINSVDEEMYAIIKKKNNMINDLYTIFKEASIESYKDKDYFLDDKKEYIFDQLEKNKPDFQFQFDVLEKKYLIKINYTLNKGISIQVGYLDKNNNHVWTNDGEFVGYILDINNFEIINNILVYEIINTNFEEFPLISSLNK